MYAPPPALNLVVIRSTDIERAQRFYVAMGLPFARQSHGAGPSHYASGVCGLVVEIYPLAPGQPATTATRLGFQVEAVDTLIAGLVEAGGAVVVAPREVPGGRGAVVSDPDGHRVELFTPVGGHDVGTYLAERPLIVGEP
jgi:predicted enzyme related to lactoylglutathione lyase